MPVRCRLTGGHPPFFESQSSSDSGVCRPRARRTGLPSKPATFTQAADSTGSNVSYAHRERETRIGQSIAPATVPGSITTSVTNPPTLSGTPFLAIVRVDDTDGTTDITEVATMARHRAGGFGQRKYPLSSNHACLTASIGSTLSHGIAD